MKIEYKQLVNLGLSKMALDFYTNTDPLTIHRNDDGSYSVAGCVEFTSANDSEFIADMESFAAAFVEEE